ncbi:cobalamin biosynthesis protein [Oceanimonas baumannii]|uniref:Adenosylcobinamide-phosphate synthase n=1 Tax=Oceanimonas baumannii TaxID=129578 RepID=A0A235CB92_9GAMM|nr:cobalamin biosynthesis protein [Oceanimonas baumannii]OYD21257.1 cobalamin biosynthesis protein CbiB [Oceanimonas baumannii]TDW55361.1 adenosylcobinamide-phosphate synthase [Oceanimonas baumannii]
MTFLLEHPLSLLTLALLLSLLQPADKLQSLLTTGLTRLGRRLNKPGYAQGYLRVAGAGLLLVILLPLLAAWWALTELAPWPALLDVLLLWGCFDAGRLSRRLPLCLTQIAEQRELARLTLAPLCLRQTEALSELGLRKTVAEVAVLRLSADFALACWYLAGGIYTALVFVLLRLAVQAWSSKLSDWRTFGSMPSVLYRAMAWLPYHLLALTLLLYPGSRRALRAWSKGQLWAFPAAGRLLAMAAAGVDAGLGGPRRYTQTTEYYPKLGGSSSILSGQTRALVLRLSLALLFWLSLAWMLTLVPLLYA